jgi:hypothetical protein
VHQTLCIVKEAVSTTGLFDTRIFAKTLPGHTDSVTMSRILDHSAYHMIDWSHTQRTPLTVQYTQIKGTQNRVTTS